MCKGPEVDGVAGEAMNRMCQQKILSDRPAQKVYMPHCFLGSDLQTCNREMAWGLGARGSPLEE